jgi:hypothetical protein
MNNKNFFVVWLIVLLKSTINDVKKRGFRLVLSIFFQGLRIECKQQPPMMWSFSAFDSLLETPLVIIL